MTTFAPISLNADWRSYPPEDVDPVYSAGQLDDSSWDYLPTLSEWPRHLLNRVAIVHLQRRFDLEPIREVCLRFILHIDAAPEGTDVYVNGWHAGKVPNGQSLSADVTDYVTLVGNVLLLKVTKAGRFGEMRLQRVPCE